MRPRVVVAAAAATRQMARSPHLFQGRPRCSLPAIATALPPNSPALAHYLLLTYGSVPPARLASWSWDALDVVHFDNLPSALVREACTAPLGRCGTKAAASDTASQCRTCERDDDPHDCVYALGDASQRRQRTPHPDSSSTHAFALGLDRPRALEDLGAIRGYCGASERSGVATASAFTGVAS